MGVLGEKRDSFFSIVVVNSQCFQCTVFRNKTLKKKSVNLNIYFKTVLKACIF